jgi:hypothetical protein
MMPSFVNMIALLWGITSALLICWPASRALASSNPRSTFWTCMIAGTQIVSLAGIAVLRDRVLAIERAERDTFISYYAGGLVIITVAFFATRARSTRR